MGSYCRSVVCACGTEHMQLGSVMGVEKWNVGACGAGECR